MVNVFFSLTYEAARQGFTIWQVIYHEEGEARFDRVLEIRDSDFARADVGEAVDELKNEFDYQPSIGPFRDIIPASPRATKLLVKIAETIADQRGYNQGRIDYMREHDV